MRFRASRTQVLSLGAATLQARRWVAQRLLRHPVRDLPLDLTICIGRSFETLGTPAVVDGLGPVACFRPDPEVRKETQRVAARTGIRSIHLPDPPGIRDFDMSWSRRTAVMQLPSITDARVRSLHAPPIVEKSCTRSLSLAPMVPALGHAGAWFLPGDAHINNGTIRIRRMPQIRSAAERDSLSLQECDSFLREAETTRGIPPGRSELLAVFRRVPVEEVSKIRFVEAKGLLFFTCEQDRRSRQTRVHDVAAVRNLTTAQTHLVAHRTRFCSVTLG